jgi:hypothetical protein
MGYGHDGNAVHVLLCPYACREILRRLSFWLSFLICFLIHTIVLFIFFKYILSDWQSLCIWLRLPVVLAEIFVLLIVIKRMEDLLQGERRLESRFCNDLSLRPFPCMLWAQISGGSHV